MVRPRPEEGEPPSERENETTEKTSTILLYDGRRAATRRLNCRRCGGGRSQLGTHSGGIDDFLQRTKKRGKPRSKIVIRIRDLFIHHCRLEPDRRVPQQDVKCSGFQARPLFWEWFSLFISLPQETPGVISGRREPSIVLKETSGCLRATLSNSVWGMEEFQSKRVHRS